MGALVEEFDRIRARRRRVGVLIALAVLAGVGAWLTGPYGIVLLLAGEATGWMLAVAGILLLAAAVTCVVLAVRWRVTVTSSPGKADPHFDQPEASRDPRPGGAWIDSGIGSR